MSNGLDHQTVDLIDKLNDGIPLYSDLIPVEDLEMLRWRTSLKLSERAVLEKLNATRSFKRVGIEGREVATIVKLFEKIESALASIAASHRPSSEQVQAGGVISGEHGRRASAADAEIVCEFKLEGGTLNIDLSGTRHEKHLTGFYGPEPNGRWTGPSNFFSVKLPYGALHNAGAGVLTFALNEQMQRSNLKALKIWSGNELKPVVRSMCSVTPNELTIPLDILTDDDVITLQTDRTQQLGADPRSLGLFVHSITVR